MRNGSYHFAVSYLFGGIPGKFEFGPSHGYYFRETLSSQNTHGEFKRALSDTTEAFQKGTLGYLLYLDIVAMLGR